MRRVLKVFVFAAVSAFFVVGSGNAKIADETNLLLVAVTKDMVVFVDNRPGRAERNTADATLFTFHVLSKPQPTPAGKVSWFMRRTKFDCLKPQLSQQLTMGYDDNGEVVATDYVEKPMMPFQMGSVSQDLSIMACDAFSANGELKQFTSLAAAIAHAKEQMAAAAAGKEQ